MRPRLVVVAALAAAAAAGLVAGSADAQSAGTVVVAPAEADPGGTVVVANARESPCTPPLGTAKPSASVDLYATGSATPTNQRPYLGVVTPLGTWSVEVRLAPDLPPGPYRVQAGCYTDSGLNAGFGPIYSAGRLQLRQQALAPPRLSTRLGRPTDTVQITSSANPCVPPVGAGAPRVRVSLLDAGRATRAESEGTVDAATGRWSVSLTVPSVEAQDGEFSAVCLARVGASVPYARYEGAPFSIQAPSTAPTSAPKLPTTATPSTVPGTPTTSTTAPPVTELPVTPLARAIVAEPTYTG